MHWMCQKRLCFGQFPTKNVDNPSEVCPFPSPPPFYPVPPLATLLLKMLPTLVFIIIHSQGVICRQSYSNLLMLATL